MYLLDPRERRHVPLLRFLRESNLQVALFFAIWFLGDKVLLLIINNPGDRF